MIYLQIFFARLKKFPVFLWWLLKDFFGYVKRKGWKEFNEWGLHIYLGKFGAGKTCTMVHDAYRLCKKYQGLTIVTNLKLMNFPEDTTILPLNSIQDILNAPNNTIVLVDEIGTIFNSRDFANGKTKDGEGGLPKILFQHICQCRHRNIMIFGTVQRWGFLDKQLREITADVTVCEGWWFHPFVRMITNYIYDPEHYNMFYQSPIRPLVPIGYNVWIQSDFYRGLYDTTEMVDTLLTMEYISDEDIERNRQFDLLGLAPPPTDKKEEKRTRSRLSKR